MVTAPTLHGVRFVLKRGEVLTEEVAQAALDDYECPLDFSPLEEKIEWDGDENSVYSTAYFECSLEEHTYRYEQERAVLEDALERYAVDARPFPIQCDHRHPDTHSGLFVPWGAARRAYQCYARLFGREQSLERLAERGGFGERELAAFLQNPKTASEATRLCQEQSV